MSDFEFVFSLFGLLLGLSLAEVLGGLARTIEARLRPGATMRVGWLTPLLAVFVILDLLSFWGAAWTGRGMIAVSSGTLLAITAFAGAYFLAAALVFPRDLGSVVQVDDHFFRVRRIVMGVMLALLASQIGWYATQPALAARLTSPRALVLTVVLVALMIAAMAVRGERACRAVMATLVARYVFGYLI